MKKLLLVAVPALLVIGGGVAVSHRAQQYQLNQEAKALSVEQQHSKELKDANEHIKSLQSYNGEISAENERLTAECAKGELAYEKHTVWSKTQLEKPTCSQ